MSLRAAKVHKLQKDHVNRRRLLFGRGLFSDKSDARVGHLNTILARGVGSLNDSTFKSSNARALPEGEGGLKFPFDRRINKFRHHGSKEHGWGSCATLPNKGVDGSERWWC